MANLNRNKFLMKIWNKNENIHIVIDLENQIIKQLKSNKRLIFIK